MERMIGFLLIMLLCSYSLSSAKDIYSPDNDARLDPSANEIRKPSSEVGDDYQINRNTYNPDDVGPLNQAGTVNNLNTTIDPILNGTRPDVAPNSMPLNEFRSSLPAAGDSQTAVTSPDNTAINQRDRQGATLTPLDQSQDPADLAITQQIRKTIVDDGSLSLTAENIKIITISGIVTLRGVVKNEEEKVIIEAKAQSVPNVKKILNQLEVKN